ncbi:hypothetical protein MOTC310_08680 [Methylobacterium oryzae]|uniref:Secreted protein n=1 Tax=Methylobacterium oryzae TaxID=334852 RepID=A0ABU7TM20_9HYPH
MKSVASQICAAGVFSASVVCAGSLMAEPLPLSHGNYVQADLACGGAPLAALRTYDGQGLGGPHDSKCVSKIIDARGKTYKIATSCAAAGDGSPVVPTTTSETVIVQSRGSFKIVDASAGDRGGVSFKLCAGSK